MLQLIGCIFVMFKYMFKFVIKIGYQKQYM